MPHPHFVHCECGLGVVRYPHRPKRENFASEREFMRAYMKAVRAEERAKGIKRRRYKARVTHDSQAEFSARWTRDAKYDPKRDAPLRWSDHAAQLLGDPPIGRRAIDKI